jgi:hypothetical protein
LKVNAETKERLDSAARANGRTQSQEAEARIQNSFDFQALLPDVLRLAYGSHFAGILIKLADLMQTAGRHAAAIEPGSARWLEDAYSYDQAVEAAKEVLADHRPTNRLSVRLPHSDNKLELYEREKPRTLLIEYNRTLQGRPATDWFQETAPHVVRLLGEKRIRKLKTSPLTAEIKDHEMRLVEAEPKVSGRK